MTASIQTPLGMEATLPLDSAKQIKKEKRANRERSDSKDGQQTEEDLGGLVSFRLEEAFLAACKDGNLPVVRFCLENR